MKSFQTWCSHRTSLRRAPSQKACTHGLDGGFMTHRRTIVRALPAACLASAAIFAAPAAATPDDTHPTSASSEWGSGCFVHDANGTATFDPSCEYHLQLQFDPDGNLVRARDHDTRPATAEAGHT